MSNRLPLSVLLPCLALIAYHCEPVIPPGVWVTIDPIQCLGNPWEQDWLQTHEYDQYPRDERGRLRIFREYYEQQDVSFHTITLSGTGAGGTCDGCGCSDGTASTAALLKPTCS